MDKKTRLKIQRIKRKENGNFHTKKYEKTFKGFIMRMYRNMKSRVTGVQYKKAHLYEGKELLDKKDFYSIAMSSEKLKTLFTKWEASNYCKKLTPSVDRLDPKLGYTPDNIQWLTHSENSAKVTRKKV